MEMSLPVFPYPDGRVFVPNERIIPDQIPRPIGIDSDETLLRHMIRMWDRCFDWARPEHERLRRCSMYYDGLHFESPEDNLGKEITNYPFSVVETVWPEMTEARPRAEIVPGYGVSSRVARQLQEVATWLQSTSGFDHCNRLCTREILKLGWTPALMTIDPRTGMPYPKPWNNWDFYPDPCAAREDSMMHYFLAGPVHTVVLQAMFPDRMDIIKPDNWTSPSYDALIRPHREMHEYSRSRTGAFVTGSAGQDSGFGQPASVNQTGQTRFSNMGGGYQTHGVTTFLYQLHVRDLSKMTVVYRGKMYRPDGTWHWDQVNQDVTACDSGWRVIQATPHGILSMAPLDSCWGGMNIVIGRDYEQAHRWWSFGEIDQVIPKTRGINRRVNSLNEALEQQANAPVLVDSDAGANFDKASILNGEVIRKRRGSTVEWFEPKGPAEHQFVMLDGQRRDIDVISGVHDVQQGQQTPGLQTGIAIQRLQNAANTRVRGKESGMHEFRAAILKKTMVAMGKKLNRRILYRASNGEMVTLDPEVLQNEFEIQFAPGSGLASSQEQEKNEAIALFERGAIDQQALLEVFNVRDRDAILARMAAAQERALAMSGGGGGDEGDDDGGGE